MYSEAAGTLADLHQKLGGENGSEVLEGLKKFLRGENPFKPKVKTETVSQPIVAGESSNSKWEVRDGVIYITLPASEGVTGPQWIKRLVEKDFQVSKHACGLLKSKYFKPTTGVVYKLAILTAKFWSDSERITRNIRAEGQTQEWVELNPEAICILRENFSDEDLEKMGFLYIVGVHELVGAIDDLPYLSISRHSSLSWLNTTHETCRAFNWGDCGAFAWSLSQENHS